MVVVVTVAMSATTTAKLWNSNNRVFERHRVASCGLGRVTMEELADQPIEQIVHRFQKHGFSRSRLVALLAALGVSGTGLDLLVSTKDAQAALPPMTTPQKHAAVHHKNKKLPQGNVQRQGQVTKAGAPPAGILDASRAQQL
jgi:hypothetical protein